MGNYIILNQFISTLQWYGKDDVKGFLEKYNEELHTTRSDYPWVFMYAKELHMQYLRNDYECVLAFFVYRFGDAGAYSYVYDMYEEEIKDEPLLKMMFDCWMMLEPKNRNFCNSCQQYCWSDIPTLTSLYLQNKDYDFSVYILAIIYYLGREKMKDPQIQNEVEELIGHHTYLDVIEKYFELKPIYGWKNKILEDYESTRKYFLEKTQKENAERINNKKIPKEHTIKKSKYWKLFLRNLYIWFDVKERIKDYREVKIELKKKAEILSWREQEKRKAEEEARKEQEILERLTAAIDDMHQMVKNDASEAQYLRSMCGRWKRCIDRGDYENIINELNIYNSQYVAPINAVHIADGLNLQIQCVGDSYANHNEFYVTNNDGFNDNDIYKYLEFEPSVLGAYAAYLIYSSWHILPLGWHANYAHNFYVHRDDELKDLPFKHDLSGKRYKVEPEVYWKDNCAYINSTYWNSWSGLVRETIRITFEGKKVKEITEIYKDILFKYKCDIIF